MLKRKFIIIGLFVLSLVGITSCTAVTDWLSPKPESQIVLDEYWKSATDVQSVLASCYRGLTQDDNIYSMIVWGELRSDNMTIGSGFASDRSDMQKILIGSITSENKYCSWGSFYTVINYCNTLLYYAPIVMQRDYNFTQSDLNRVKAEALTIRALCYFYLVRSFKEVPWIKEASIDNTQKYLLSKETEANLINHIIADLDTARLYAQTDFGRTDYNKGRITLNTVNALLADVYLWNQDYDKCVQACDFVLADKKLKLVQPPVSAYYSVFYTGNSTESIFELQFKENVQVNNPVAKLYGSSANILGEIGFPATLAYDPKLKVRGGTTYSCPFAYPISSTITESPNDIRSIDSYKLYGGQYFIFKYAGMLPDETLAGRDIWRTNTANWIIYRLSDVMLMKAEALVQLGGNSNLKNALLLVNQTYLRSNTGKDSLNITNYGTQTAMEDLVLRERQREFLFEGKRWYDLVRMARRDNSTDNLNMYVNNKSSGNSATLGALVLDAMYMPIATSELQANPNLKQNPFYKESSSITK